MCPGGVASTTGDGYGPGGGVVVGDVVGDVVVVVEVEGSTTMGRLGGSSVPTFGSGRGRVSGKALGGRCSGPSGTTFVMGCPSWSKSRTSSSGFPSAVKGQMLVIGFPLGCCSHPDLTSVAM